MPANPVRRHDPVLTVKVTDVAIKSDIGRDWSIEILPIGFGVTTVKVRRGKQNTFLLQQPWDTQSPSTVDIQIKLTEKDKISDYFGPQTYNLSVDKSLPIDNDPSPTSISGHRKGQKVIALTVVGQGGDVGKTANVAITFDWFLSYNMDDLVSYIDIEMTNNLKTKEFANLKDSVAKASSFDSVANGFLKTMPIPLPGIPVGTLATYLYFRELVGYNRPWDHKPPIYRTCGEWSLDKERGLWYRFDIFSNIHYGYVGRAAGFTVRELLDGAGLAQALNGSNYGAILANAKSLRVLDDPIDQKAIKIGIDLWNKYNSGISKNIIWSKIRSTRGWGKGRKPADEGRWKKK